MPKGPQNNFVLEMQINKKDVQDMTMGESDSQMDYEDEVKLTNKRIVTKLPMTTPGKKDKNKTKEKRRLGGKNHHNNKEQL